MLRLWWSTDTFLSQIIASRKRFQNWKMFTGFQFLPIFLPWSALADQPPNILLFLVDDLGHGDLGYPVTIHISPPTNQQQQQQHHRYLGHPTSSSPNIDRLAMDSVQFTQFYTARFEFWTKHCKNCNNLTVNCQVAIMSFIFVFNIFLFLPLQLFEIIRIPYKSELPQIRG